MNTLYSTKVTATGGRHGQIRSEDGLLEMKLALPRQLGGKGDATNPETLFAGGYAACFENALLHVSRDAGSGLRTQTSKSSRRSVSVAMTRAASCCPLRSRSLSPGSTRTRRKSWLSLPTKSAPIPKLFGATSTLGSRFRFVEQDRTKTWDNRSRALL
jgi:Ohr subfamily peroxiredoxin